MEHPYRPASSTSKFGLRLRLLSQKCGRGFRVTVSSLLAVWQILEGDLGPFDLWHEVISVAHIAQSDRCLRETRLSKQLWEEKTDSQVSIISLTEAHKVRHVVGVSLVITKGANLDAVSIDIPNGNSSRGAVHQQTWLQDILGTFDPVLSLFEHLRINLRLSVVFLRLLPPDTCTTVGSGGLVSAQTGGRHKDGLSCSHSSRLQQLESIVTSAGQRDSPCEVIVEIFQDVIGKHLSAQPMA